MKRVDTNSWLNETLLNHKRLTEVLVPLLNGLIKQGGIEYLSVTGRTKDVHSASEKIKRKKYTRPDEQMTDMTGIRIITFFDSHVKEISDLITSSFDVDNENSLDRASLLGMDKLGYRSVHFVCTLGKERSKLPEFNKLGDLKFEIQIRTVLQHAWAELAHDRAYKFPGVLPPELQRKLNLYSGMLEITDAAFDEIASQIDDYKRRIVSGELDQTRGVPIDSINVKKYIDKYAEEAGTAVNGEVDAEIIGELRAFEISEIGSFDDIIIKNRELIFKNVQKTSYAGVARDAMMLDDIDKYFSQSFSGSWGWCDNNTFDRLSSKYSQKKVENVFRDYDILLEEDFDEEIYDVEDDE